MNETLIIAEKPSVAMTIGRAIGADKRGKGCIMGGGYVVTWCYGHLIDLADADIYDEKYESWNISDLPIIPKKWEYVIKESANEQYMAIYELLKSEEIKRVVCATDAGREGELIFRDVYEMAKCDKPALRLWLSSYEDEEIRKAIADARPDSDFEGYYKAADALRKATWLLGINATRYFTRLYHGKRMNVGPVKMPTLSMIVDRDKLIDGFKQANYYTLEADADGVILSNKEIFADKVQADAAAARLSGEPATVTSVLRETKTEAPPKLYDLTTLQREANRLFGYTASETLDAAQWLYEKKYSTYARTDSKFITTSQICQAEKTAELLGLKKYCAEQCADDSKVGDHSAIIPTLSGVTAAHIEDDKARNVFGMVKDRFILAVNPDKYEYETVTAEVCCKDALFSVKGKRVVAKGWKADAEESEAPVMLRQGDVLRHFTVSAKKHTSTAPKRFTEDTLLSAMENAGASELEKDVERRGLGTPATRAKVIDELVASGCIERKGKSILSTKKGKDLIAIIPADLRSPSVMSEWENRLLAISRGDDDPNKFVRDAEEFTKYVISTPVKREYKDAFILQQERESVGSCPRCGSPVYEGKNCFYCADGGCGFKLFKDNRLWEARGLALTKTAVKTLLKKGEVSYKRIKDRDGKSTFEGTVKLRDDGTRVSFAVVKKI